MSESQAEATLGATLRHPTLAVRRRAAAFLKSGGSARSATYFVDALRTENDPSLRALFVESLGALRHDASLPLLGQILEARAEADAVRVAAAGALGSLGKPQAIPILARAGTRPPRLTLVLSPVPPTVRAAALRALGSYTHHPESREALRRSLEDAEPSIRDAARESLLAPILKVFGDFAREAALVSDSVTLEGFSNDGVAGYLAEVPLDQICFMLEENGRTGLLMLNVGGSIAQVRLQRGGVVLAEYNGAKGQEAFNQFCRWEGAHFLFVPGAAPAATAPPQSLIKMLMDACEVRDHSGPARS
jgi:hypothetical protein